MSAATIRQAVYSWLTSQTAVTSLVGEDVFPLKAKQGTLRPYVLYRRKTAGQAYQLAGSAERAQCLFEFTVVADGYASADAVITAVAEALDTINRTQVGDVLLYSAQLDEEEDEFEEPIDGGDTGLYVVRLDALLTFSITGAANP